MHYRRSTNRKPWAKPDFIITATDFDASNGSDVATVTLTVCHSFSGRSLVQVNVPANQQRVYSDSMCERIKLDLCVASYVADGLGEW